MKIPKGFKIGIIPKKEEKGFLLICTKCGGKYFYYGSALPPKKLKCEMCKIRSKVNRNPRIIKRN